jgi:hypothetical protein
VKRLCAIAVVLALASGAVAQSDTFDAELETALAPAEDRAELISCLALFRSFRVYFGADTEAGAEAGAREVDMTVLSSVIWQGATGATLDEAMAAILPLADAATELYTARFEANHDETGDLFDAGLTGRLASCDTLRAHLVEALP